MLGTDWGITSFRPDTSVADEVQKHQVAGSIPAPAMSMKDESPPIPSLFPDSSAVEQLAVNQRAVGSIPTQGATFIAALYF